MTFKSIVFTIAFILIQSALFCQNDLSKLSYEQLKDSLVKHSYPKKYAEAYLTKAKREQNKLRISFGYENMAHAVTPKEALIYCDSLITISHEIKRDNYPAFGYMLKGYFLYELGKDKEALEAYLIAYNYANEKNHSAQKRQIEEFIGAIKLNLGQYKAALKIFKKRYVYVTSQPNYKETHKEDYLYAIDDLSSCYLRAKMLDSAEVKIKEGLRFSLKNKDSIWYRDFLAKSAFHLYFENENMRALDSFQKAEQLSKKPIHLSINYYYQGKIHQKLGNIPLAISFFNKVDSIYIQNNNTYIELKEVYKILYEYHFKQEDKAQQAYALEKLIEVDSILDELSVTVNSRSISDYEIPKLKAEKAKLLGELNKEHDKTSYIIITSIVISIILIIILIKLNLDKKKLKNRFYNIVQTQDDIAPTTKVGKTPKVVTQKPLSISKDIIDNVLGALTHFENNKAYLDNQITLTSLAKQFNTNSVYLSKIVNHYKGVSLSKYLNNLRINYCVSELRHNLTLRNYTIKALAQEMGFRNTESFSNAFKKQTGLNPSYFIKELNNLDESS